MSLPIHSVLPLLADALVQRDEAILVAAPGAGKTTQVPLALLQAPWLGEQRILLLEPRRLAARTAAQRMAELLGEKPGETVGYRMRLDSKESSATRILVVTEGVLTRMLHSDPSLEGYGLLIFDEYHERSLDADLGLALSLYARSLFRHEARPESPGLKLLLMSATLDSESLSALL
ncbi:MAG TPA: ATP-dependent helicase HrpB, partial [Spongiibacteraceae bacterium]|nr:ATP-dependent helicase HrpB [Spongiibacteraceae bacterium]